MKKLFCVILGPRLAGKTTLAGTLPGKTILLQAAVLESGSRSAAKLAARQGNVLVTEGYVFEDLTDFWPKLDAAFASDADHIYIDGFSAMHEIRWHQDDIQKLHKNNTFAAYDRHGTDMIALLRRVKEASYGDKNVFLTCSVKVDKQPGADVPEARLEVKGKMTIGEITKIGEAVLTVIHEQTEHGSKRVMITKTRDLWSGRIDGILDDENPQTIEPPSLAVVLKLLEESK